MAWLVVWTLIVIMLWAPALPLVTRRMVRALGVYAGMTFGIRPLFLLIVNPKPALGVPIANSLLLTPTYWDGIQQTAVPIAGGLTVFLIAIYSVSRAFRSRGQSGILIKTASDQLAVLWVVWSFGWLCRLAILSHVVAASNPVGLVASRMLPVGMVVLGWTVIKTDWRSDSGLRRLVITAAIGESIWAVLSASKTPLLAGVLFFYIDPSRPRLSVRIMILTVISIIGAFDGVQTLKGVSSAAAKSVSPLQELVERIITRFDQLNAVAVSQQAGPHSYMTWGDAARQALVDWIPQQLMGVHRVTDGQRWAIVMEHTLSGVALATGSVAEGYAIGGSLGIMVFGAVGGGLFALSAWLVESSRNFIVGMLCVYVIASGALFEQGALGVIDVVSGGLQLCLIVLFLEVLVKRPTALASPAVWSTK